MIIECCYCDAKVDAKSLVEKRTSNNERLVAVHVLECPYCRNILIGSLEYVGSFEGGAIWADLQREWPRPRRHISRDMPELVRHYIQEAEKCFQAGAFDACELMCVRMLDGICQQHQAKKRYQDGGLRELLDQQVIDRRMHAWGDELRKRRASEMRAMHSASSAEAKDFLDFSHALCDSIFEVNRRFEEFVARARPKAA